jgi:uncharacterized protein YodC (DUF2158 family)
MAKIGENVILNSGSPIMTVKTVDDEKGTVTCVWCEVRQNAPQVIAQQVQPQTTFQEAEFATATLTVISKPV